MSITFSKFRLLLVTGFVAAVAAAPLALAQSAFDDPGARAVGTTGAAGDLKPVADKVDAGEVVLGSSAQVVVLFRNDDNKPVKTGAINLYPSSNISATVGENQCALNPIAPGEVCAISISVKGLQQGNYRIEMLMRHDGRAKLLTTTINGAVASTGSERTDLVSDIETIPNEIDFGTLNESRSQVKAVILRNKTSKSLLIQSIEVEAGKQSGYTVNSNCGELKTGEACVASVTWEPKQRGPSTGTMIVRHNGATSISTIELTGEYEPESSEMAEVFPQAIPGKGLLVSSQEQVDFGSGVSQSSSITVSLVNAGDAPLTLSSIRMTNAENGVRTEQSGCYSGEVLAPLEACPLTLTWEPVRAGSIVDDIRISHTGARGILVLPLRGDAANAVNKDKKAIMLGGDPSAEAIIRDIQPLSLKDIEEDGELVIEDGDKATAGGKKASGSSGKGTSGGEAAATPKSSSVGEVDIRGTLDGYNITSYSPRRAIINGPGGSRVVFDGEQTVIGGVLWDITMRPSAIEFRSGTQKVLLLFDKSLSSVNLIDAQSSSGTASSPGGSTSPAGSATSMSPSRTP